ncbi:alkylated DNA repair protein alkB homolog 8 [Phlebotomus argentipes]|uniref:alkylated DNA repair protein alkB homolog 8 n=1 Tax=Phlebotomus argentipes TaxID=94469 RepID=UPI0028935FE2|nr:alkylated DNA repair protein alkB homolog 8 [Phlebotomus argentipes]
MTSQQCKKLQKKTRRCQVLIEQNTGIKCTDTVEMNLVICNAGLSTGLRPESVLEVIGGVGKISAIIMLPGKSFCFLSCPTIEDSDRIFQHLHGKAKLAQNQGLIFLSFCRDLPKIESPWERNTIPPGLVVLKDFISEEEEEKLMKCVNWTEEASGKELKHRQVKHFGYEFRYGSNDVDPEVPLNEKIPQECHILWERMHKKYPDIDWSTPDQLTVNKYAPGQGIPPHCDTHSAFSGPIVSLSLGSDVVMEFRSASGEDTCVLLPRRCILLMTGESRYNWTHGITPRCMDIVPSGSENASLTILKRSIRISFTFRTLRRGECDCNYSTFCDTKKRETEKGGNSLELAKIASKVEEENVHKIYNEIAQHFSETRHSPWPKVAEFIASLPSGSSLMDIGCGNGKYLLAREDVIKIGCDRSDVLLKVCQERQLNTLLCDCLAIPVRSNSVSACISIAVIHHLASEDRRVQAVREMARILEKSGRGLIYVWAKNQEADKKKSSYLKQNKKCNEKDENPMRDDKLPLPVHTNRTQFKHRDILVPWKLKDGTEHPKTFLRFYHVFEEGELEELCGKIEGIEVIQSYYDQGNWCVVFEKTLYSH